MLQHFAAQCKKIRATRLARHQEQVVQISVGKKKRKVVVLTLMGLLQALKHLNSQVMKGSAEELT
jgi:hypothetical protein